VEGKLPASSITTSAIVATNSTASGQEIGVIWTEHNQLPVDIVIREVVLVVSVTSEHVMIGVTEGVVCMNTRNVMASGTTMGTGGNIGGSESGGAVVG